MGLFIGASILTILELFDYLYEVRRLQEIRVCYLWSEAPIEEVAAVMFSVLFFPPRAKKNSPNICCICISSFIPVFMQECVFFQFEGITYSYLFTICNSFP